MLFLSTFKRAQNFQAGENMLQSTEHWEVFPSYNGILEETIKSTSIGNFTQWLISGIRKYDYSISKILVNLWEFALFLSVFKKKSHPNLHQTIVYIEPFDSCMYR